jgi:anaerobic magnesium-protoporphyrin IX monomethyl ester cyclase
MKIFLGNAPWSKPGFYGVRAGSRWPHFEKEHSKYMPFPFFLGYATALLEKNGFECLLVDGIAEGISLDSFLLRMQSFGSHIVVFEVSTPSIELDLDVARSTKKLLGQDVQVVFCGPHHSMYSPDFLKQHRDVDYVIQGEYELVLLDLVQRLARREPITDVLGLIYRSGEDIVVNERRPLETDLGKFPWPARHHLPMDKYCDLPGGIPAPSLQIWASRGCPFHCIFCSWPQIMYGSNQYRVRDPKDVVEEIDWCIKKYGFKSVYFDDDTFNIGKPRLLALCEELKKKGIDVPWAIMARADCMDRELLSAMKEAGLVALKYGVESGVQEILDVTGKSLNLDTVRETVSITRQLGIKFHLTFTFGLPGETIQTIEKTVRLALELNPDSLQFSIVTPFPGSRYFQTLDKQGYILSKNWEEYDGYNKAVIRTDHLSRTDLEKALTRANRRWKRHVLKRRVQCEPVQTLTNLVFHPVKALRSYYS